MSYIHMDHAGWVERNIAAGKRMATKADHRRAKEHQQGPCAAPDSLNDFQRRAFTILGIVGGGIYNAPISWDRVWWHPKMLSVSWQGELASFDFMQLTRLVFLCHEARIRVGVQPRAPRHLAINLSARVARGGASSRHPNLEEALAEFRLAVPVNHSIFYRVSEEAAA